MTSTSTLSCKYIRYYLNCQGSEEVTSSNYSVMSFLCFEIPSSASSSPPPRGFAARVQDLLRDAAAVTMEHQIAVKTPSLGERALIRKPHLVPLWLRSPVLQTCSLPWLLFHLPLQSHLSVLFADTATQQSDLSSPDSCLSGWGAGNLQYF